MPFALAVIGILLVVAGAKGKSSYQSLAALLKSAFTGEHNFFVWIVAFGTVGAVGYIRPLQPLSRAFMLLILVAMFVKGGQQSQGDRVGFFKQFMDALTAPVQASTTTDSSASTSASGATTAAPSASSGLSIPSLGDIGSWVGNRLWSQSLPGQLFGGN